MLSKSNRLHSVDFKLMRGTRAVHSPHLFARIARNAESEDGRAAAVVSSAVAKKAVTRNLLRRRIYEALRPHLPLPSGSRLAITAKKGAPALSFKELQSELSLLLARI
jgi:ribonuclease P protein component